MSFLPSLLKSLEYILYGVFTEPKLSDGLKQICDIVAEVSPKITVAVMSKLFIFMFYFFI
jgi:hypothetical protein